MTHPDLETLFDNSHHGRPSPEIAAHLDVCPRCRETFSRLKAGALLMQEAREHTPDVDFSRMDDVLAREAVSAARSMRVVPLRPATRWGTYTAMGVSLAAAAGVALWLRLPHDNLDAPASAPIAAAPATPAAPAVSPLASRVLSSHGEVSSHADALDDGAVLSTGSDGSATVALGGAWQLDVRPSSEVALDHVNDPSAITLARGECVVRPNDGDAHHPLALRARRWTVDADGTLTARTEFNRVRVMVLSGRVTTHNGPVSSVFSGPVDLSLPDSGDRAERIDPVVPAVAVAVAPRTAGPTEPSGRGTQHPAPPTPVATAPVAMAAAAEAPTALDVVPSAVRSADANEQRYVRAQGRTALSSCVIACREQGTCTGPVSLSVLVDTNGHVTRAHASGDMSPQARMCFEREARSMAISAPDSAFRFDFTIDE